MAHFEHSISIAAAPETVFSVLSHVRSHPRWQQGLLKAESEKEAPHVGEKGVEVRRMLGREMRFPYEITAFDAPQLWGFRALSGPIRPEARVTLTPEGEGTRVHSLLVVPGLLGRLAGGALLKQQKSNYEQLKRLIESGELV